MNNYSTSAALHGLWSLICIISSYCTQPYWLTMYYQLFVKENTLTFNVTIWHFPSIHANLQFANETPFPWFPFKRLPRKLSFFLATAQRIQSLWMLRDDRCCHRLNFGDGCIINNEILNKVWHGCRDEREMAF